MNKKQLFNFLFDCLVKQDSTQEMAKLKDMVYGRYTLKVTQDAWQSFIFKMCNDNDNYFQFCFLAYHGILRNKEVSSEIWSDILKYYNRMKNEQN